MENPDRLLLAWDGLCARTGLQPAVDVGAALVAAYGESGRAYHNLDHLAQVLNLLARMQADDRLVFAAWFHDAVYRPGSRDNESRSAELARSSLSPLGYPEDAIRFVCDAILATASHRSGRAEFAPLLDADLAILGSEEGQYRVYRKSIREEYAAISDTAFAAGRMAFLRALLACPAIYQTGFCKLGFESAARLNIQTELDELVRCPGLVSSCA